mgnify:CR=1 FL=1
MKKFFTLCLAFMLASLLNVNAADTYTLVGDLNSWNTSAEGYNFTYVEATDSYVLEGVTLKGEFKIVKNNSWANPAFGANGNDVPLDAAYIMWNTDSGNMKMIDGKEAVYNDCKLELKKVKFYSEPLKKIFRISCGASCWIELLDQVQTISACSRDYCMPILLYSKYFFFWLITTSTIRSLMTHYNTLRQERPSSSPSSKRKSNQKISTHTTKTKQ